MIQDKAQFQEWIRNEMFLCEHEGIVYLTEYARVRRNVSEQAQDEETERQIDQEQEEGAEPPIHWEPAFI